MSEKTYLSADRLIVGATYKLNIDEEYVYRDRCIYLGKYRIYEYDVPHFPADQCGVPICTEAEPKLLETGTEHVFAVPETDVGKGSRYLAIRWKKIGKRVLECTDEKRSPFFDEAKEQADNDPYISPVDPSKDTLKRYPVDEFANLCEAMRNGDISDLPFFSMFSENKYFGRLMMYRISYIKAFGMWAMDTENYFTGEKRRETLSDDIAEIYYWFIPAYMIRCRTSGKTVCMMRWNAVPEHSV